MICSEVQGRLSAYHDGELSPDVTAEVAAHLADCSSCAAELASFSELSHMSRRLTDPPVPTRMWEELEAKLRGEKIRTAILGWIVPNCAPGRFVAIAATVLIASGIGVVAYQAWFAGGGHDHLHNHLAENFASFLDEFENRPDNAQQILLVNYEGRPTTLREAAAVLGYEPVVAKGLPAGCSLDKIYLLKLPCCICAQVVCRNKDGRSIAIFEHDSDQPVWFGDRPTVECLCHDVPTSVVQVGDKLAATWKEGQRYITIIGANDLEEVVGFVAYFNRSVVGNGWIQLRASPYRADRRAVLKPQSLQWIDAIELVKNLLGRDASRSADSTSREGEPQSGASLATTVAGRFWSSIANSFRVKGCVGGVRLGQTNETVF